MAKGLSKFETNWIKADTKESTLSVSVDIPRLDITGLYKIKGRVFIFDLVGEGDFVTVLEDVSGTGKVTFNVRASTDKCALTILFLTG